MPAGTPAGVGRPGRQRRGQGAAGVDAPGQGVVDGIEQVGQGLGGGGGAAAGQILGGQTGQQRAGIGHRVAQGGIVPVDELQLPERVAHHLLQ